MTEGGFDDIEMKKNRNMEENQEDEETSFGGDDLEDHNRSINIINTENPKRKFNRIDLTRETPEDISRRMRNTKAIITNNRNLSFKKILNSS